MTGYLVPFIVCTVVYLVGYRNGRATARREYLRREYRNGLPLTMRKLRP